MREEAVLFGETGSLVGILTDPRLTASNKDLPAIVLLNAGIVHRVGPNRLSVNIARTLATMGFVVFRFDFSGIGDSEVRGDHLPFRKSALCEVQEAMNYLSGARDSERFILMGLCSGARISFRTACCDPRVVGAVLINPMGHLHDESDEQLSAFIRNRALARHYWRIAFSSSFSAKNWLKAMTGKVDYRRAIRLVTGFRPGTLLLSKRRASTTANEVVTDLNLLAERGAQLLHIYSEGDEGLDYLHVMPGDEIKRWVESGRIEVELIPGTNHGFTLQWDQEYLLSVIQHWMRKWFRVETGP
jgi:alpha-beta hydrolase superfamily lysophospholipase